jgi:hypothetical protein
MKQAVPATLNHRRGNGVILAEFKRGLESKRRAYQGMDGGNHLQRPRAILPVAVKPQQ